MHDSERDPIPPLLQQAPPQETSRVRWLIHLLLIGIYPIALGLLGVGRYEFRGPALTHTTRGLLITCFFHLGIFGVIFLLGWLASRASRDDLLLKWRPKTWAVPLGLAYSVGQRVGLGMVAAFIFVLLLAVRAITPDQVQDFARNNQPDVSTLVDVPAMRENPAYFWLTITFVSFIVAGLREELWRSAVLGGMRKLWPRTFGSTAGQIGAVAIASIAFGLGHLSLGVLGVVSATLLGLGLGVIMVLHRSIWPAVIAHGAFDATTFALLPWAVSKLHQGG